MTLTFPRIAAALAAALCVFLVWQRWGSADERAVRSRLTALAADLNRPGGEGLAAVQRAADIGGYFTDEVVVDLGEGTSPIVGRSTLVGMAARLERRTSDANVRFDDVGVTFGRGPGLADVSLTVSFARAADASGQGSIDAREFALEMTKASGQWRIARVSAIDTLR